MDGVGTQRTFRIVGDEFLRVFVGVPKCGLFGEAGAGLAAWVLDCSGAVARGSNCPADRGGG
jgi:hypothetical protein